VTRPAQGLGRRAQWGCHGGDIRRPAASDNPRRTCLPPSVNFRDKRATRNIVNDSVMGSVFTRYKTPTYVNLDFRPTFALALLLMDCDLGFEAARQSHVAMPVAASAEQQVQLLEGIKGDEVDFAALLQLVAQGAGLALMSEEALADDGLTALPTNVEAKVLS
jgi:hypothetical protein